MSLYDILLVILLSLPAAHSDTETVEQREARMAVVATAISDASLRATCEEDWADSTICKRVWPETREELAYLLVTIGFWESRFARNVHANKCKPWECDPSKTLDGRLYHKSRSIWQLQWNRDVSRSQWNSIRGVSLVSTTEAAWIASYRLSQTYRKCRTITGAIGGYSGSRFYCRWPGAHKRFEFYELITKRARRLKQ
ncbi:MAG: hypothetical protein ACXABY_20635 [Candidatus Thorarchaeota archaeon]